MRNLYQIYLISDSTGETLDRIFLALKAQFPNFEYETNHFSFTRTESQILSILKQAKKDRNYRKFANEYLKNINYYTRDCN